MRGVEYMAFKIIVLIAAIALIIFFIIFLIRWIIFNKPTDGIKIVQYRNPNKAFLVMNMCEKFKSNYSDEFINDVNNAIQYADDNKYKVIYLYLYKKDNSEYDKRLKVINNVFFNQNFADAFSNKEFERYLVDNRVNEIYIAGSDLACSILKTSLGAKNRGYKINLIKKAIKTSSKKTLSL